jgi:hypothetical protein
MQFSDQQTEVRDELSMLSTDVAITTTMIKRWLNMGKDWALAYKRWPFLEVKGTDLIDSTGAYPYPTLMKTKSAYLVRVNSKRFVKIRYEDYLAYLEDDSDGDDKVWAEFDRTIYINGNACTVGQAVEIYGIEGVADMSADANTTPFSDAEPSGDEAVIKFAVAKGLKKVGGSTADANNLMAEARDILERIWDRLMEAAPREQLKTTPLFKRIDILDGTTRDTDPSKIGKF